MGRARENGLATHGNMWGYRGVEWRAAKKVFRARIEPPGQGRGKWLGSFATAEDAARAYDAAARQIYGDRAALNFPREGETQAIASRRSEGVCPRGHDLATHGYRRPDWRWINCRECNRLASMRAYRRRRVAAP